MPINDAIARRRRLGQAPYRARNEKPETRNLKRFVASG
jgi:hypothetical protein